MVSKLWWIIGKDCLWMRGGWFSRWRVDSYLLPKEKYQKKIGFWGEMKHYKWWQSIDYGNLCYWEQFDLNMPFFYIEFWWGKLIFNLEVAFSSKSAQDTFDVVVPFFAYSHLLKLDMTWKKLLETLLINRIKTWNESKLR